MCIPHTIQVGKAAPAPVQCYSSISHQLYCFFEPCSHFPATHRKQRACNFRHAANPAPETEEEEELEQWRPHRRTPLPPPNCCLPFFFGPSGQKPKRPRRRRRLRGERGPDARSANRGGTRRLERKRSACRVRTNEGER